MQMSRLITILVLALFSISSAKASDFALAGKVMLSGGLNLDLISGTVETDDGGESADLADRTNIGLDVLGGYFIVDGFFLGGILGVDYQSASQDGEDASQTTFNISVAPRYYLALSASREAFLLFGGSLGYVSVSQDATEEDSVTASGFTFAIEAGLAVALGQDRGAVVELTVGLTKLFLSFDEADIGVAASSDQTVIGFNVRIGTFL